MKLSHAILMLVFAVVLIVGSQSVFTVDQREQALLLQLGQPVGDVKQPGLHFKIPIVQEVRRFDRRILSVDPQPEQMVVSSSLNSPLKDITANEEEAIVYGVTSGEPIVVDTFARYRITDPLMFMKTLRTVYAANQRLESIMNDSTRGVLGNRTLKELLSEDRTSIMQAIQTRVNNKIAEDELGIEIIDIRIVRADLTPELKQSTVRRMISELKERATETRAKGEEKALEIKSTAEKEKAIILAEAERDAQIVRGEGDNEAFTIYAEAFNTDKEFYSFIRSMEAYSKTLADPDTRLILSPDSEFFRHFQEIQ
jgi:membrane protease subunit HflC